MLTKTVYTLTILYEHILALYSQERLMDILRLQLGAAVSSGSVS